MSQSNNGLRAGRRRPPPPRLGWPAVGAASAGAAADLESHSPETTNKRPRRVTFGGSDHQQPQKQLWTVKYAPKSSADLAVAPKKVKEVQAWMQQSESKLLFLVGGPGIGKSAMVHCLGAELGLEVQEWTETFYGHDSNSSSIDQLTPLNAFEQFLRQTATGFQSLQLEETSTHQKKKKKLKTNGAVILLDELPNLHGADAEARFRDILTTHVQRTAVPTIVIYSDTAEGKARPDDLERMVDASTLYSPACKIMQINAPTKAKFGKVVQQIAVSERGKSISPSYAEELYGRCGGDLRFAITTLQFEMIGDAGSSRERSSAKCANGNRSELRDTKLTSFHALGKLLYAKRQKDVATANGKRAPLQFDPECVVEQSDMEVSGVLHFLEYHCVEFFTDIGELATAMDHFSDAAVLVDHPLQGSSSSSSSSSSNFPTAYASSLAGRAVANANLHPAPFKFRQFGSPKVFDVIRKRRENESRIQTLCSGRTVTAATANDKAAFAVDVLPFVRTILPLHYVSSSFLDSYFDPSSAIKYNKQVQDDEAMAAELWKEQQEVLQIDDIVEDNDNDDNW